MRTVHRVAIVFLAVLLSPVAVSARAATPVTLERIDIRGARPGAASVIRRETRLEEQASYSDTEIRAAAARVSRLPFVVSVDTSLEQGSVPGAHVLVIAVVETKPAFVDGASLTSDFDSQPGGARTEEFVRAGGQGFVGGGMYVHAASHFDDGYEAGVTRYGVFGRAGHIGLTLRYVDVGSRETALPGGGTVRYRNDGDPSPELTFRVAAFGDHSVAGNWRHDSATFRMESSTERERRRQESDDAALYWICDTTDDELFPMSGTTWRAGTATSRSSLDVTGSPAPSFAHRSDTLFANYIRYRPVRSGVSLILGGGAGASRYDGGSAGGSSTLRTVYPQLGAAVSLLPERLTRESGALRWEALAQYTLGDNGEFRAYTFTGTTALAARTAWGTLRLAYVYVNTDFD